jgi:exonuclease SbcD
VGNIDAVKADILERFDYAALGHIHKPMKVGSEFSRYCGTPLACSVSEAGQKKGVIMVSLEEKGKVKTDVIPLIPLRQVRVITGTLQEVLMQSCGDYVTVILTDKVDFDVFDMQDKIRYAFPNLLEIRRESLRKADYTIAYSADEEMDAFTLCKSFLRDLDADEQALLRDVINTVQEVQA